MSQSTTTQNSTMGRVASRRNVIRSAAWTTAAVTVVVAAPAYAACSPVRGCPVLPLTIEQSAVTRASNGKTVDWTFKLKNTSSSTIPLNAVSGSFALSANLTVSKFSSISSLPNSLSVDWSGTSSRVYPRSIAPGEVLSVAVQISGNDTAKKVRDSAQATFKGVDYSGSVMGEEIVF